ncbi:MAG: stage II sporulation protein M [Deltaproteobacteria bacterium]|jgi:uncharacterized membrane protein SpoIIM required for sporulation|nr:stage II sporulation protein M [Deltaproteobacteria bacterium]
MSAAHPLEQPHAPQTITSSAASSPKALASPGLAPEKVPTAPAAVLRSGRFRQGRQASWTQLDQLVTKLEKKGAKSLTSQEAIALPKLYQAQISSLAVARNTILDQNLLEYLENLSLRAYLAVYGPRKSFFKCFKEFLSQGFPQSVQRLWAPIIVSALILISSTLVGLIAVKIDSGYYPLLVSPSIAQGRDYSSTSQELLEEGIFQPWSGFEESFIHFAGFLFRHNSTVSLLCFGLGFAFGIPTIFLLFSNGLLLGAMIGLHLDKGIGLEFIGWLSIHGVTELTAVVLAAGGGLAIAQGIIFPGPRCRKDNLARLGRDAAQVMMGAIIMLLVAGILEGGFRQLIHLTSLRLLIGAITGFFWATYFLKAALSDPQTNSGSA